MNLERVVRERLDHAYARARELIRVKAPLVRRLARQLLVNKVMTGDEVAALIRDAGGADPSPTLSKLSGEFYDVISGIPKTPIVERIVNCAARSVNHINFAMNAMTSKLDLRPTDRRNAKRASTLKSGKLVYGGSWGAVVDCLVLDLTDRGARVETVLTADVPEAFSLRLSDGTERRGYRRWVSGHEIGIEFADGVV